MKSIRFLTLAIFALFCASVWGEDLSSIYFSGTESEMIEILEKPGNAPEDILLKNVACKRLVIIGTDASVPTLIKMLPDEKLSYNARFALEAMTSEASAATLIDAASTLTGKEQIGVIDSIAIRKLPAAVEPLQSLLADNPSPELLRAIYTAFGKIGGDKATEILLNELNKPLPEDLKTRKVLGDAVIELAETARKGGDRDQALKLYDAVAQVDAIPLFVKKGVLYNSLLLLGADATDRVKDALTSDVDGYFEVAIRSLRGFSPEDAPAIYDAAFSVYDQLSAPRQAKVILSTREVSTDALKEKLFPTIAKELDSSDSGIQLAAVAAMGNIGSIKEEETLNLLLSNDAAINGNADYLAAMVSAVCALPEDANALIAQWNWTDAPTDLTIAKLKIVEERKVTECSPLLLKIIKNEDTPAEVRSAALSALSETVELAELNLLADALSTITDEEKIDWSLRAACTRLPREECAKEVGKLYDNSPIEAKRSLLALLLQIGGPFAVSKVEEACFVPDTVDSATEILGKWNTPDDIELVATTSLKVAKSNLPNKYKVRAIRSYIRIARQFDLGADKRIEMCRTAFNTATRQEDKLLIFEALRRINETKTVTEALSYAQYDFCVEQACATAVAAAKSFPTANDEIREAMKKVLVLTKNEELKQQAQEILNK